MRDRVGSLPAVWVLLAFYVLAGALAATVSDDTFEWASWIVVALLATYCITRRADGWNVFLIAAAPNALAALLHRAVGAPIWLGFLLIPVALLLVRTYDQPSRIHETPGPAAAG